MKILIVNNKGDNLPNIKKVLEGYNFDIIEVKDLSRDDYKGYDYVILSGGEQYEVAENPEFYREEFELIKSCDKPILGICLGLQVIGYAFGEKIEKLDKYYKRFVQFNIKKRDPIFEGIPDHFDVGVDHSWNIVNPKSFYVLGSSDYCIQAIKHKQKTIYGFQFHPEFSDIDTNAYKVIKNFLKM